MTSLSTQVVKAPASGAGHPAVPGVTQEHQQFLTFHLGEEMFAIGILSIREIIEYGVVTDVPMTPPFIRGVINLRGTVLPIIDLGARFGLETSEPTARHVIMVAHIGGRMVGLLVDAVSDILQMSDAAVQPTPDVASDRVKTFVKGIFSIDGRMISLIELDHILPQVEAEAA